MSEKDNKIHSESEDHNENLSTEITENITRNSCVRENENWNSSSEYELTYDTNSEVTEPSVSGERAIISEISTNISFENVGDISNKKLPVHILCECHPNEAGAAVPTVLSFLDAYRNELTRPVEIEDYFYDALEGKVDENLNFSEEETSTNYSSTNSEKTFAQNNFSKKEVKSKIPSSKPSLIPIPTRPLSAGRKFRTNDENYSEATVKLNNSRKLPVNSQSYQKCTVNTSTNTIPSKNNSSVHKNSSSRYKCGSTETIRANKDDSEISIKTNIRNILLMKVYENISKMKLKTDKLCKSEKNLNTKNFNSKKKDIKEMYNIISEVKEISNKLNPKNMALVTEKNVYKNYNTKEICRNFEKYKIVNKPNTKDVFKFSNIICEKIDEICGTLLNLKEILHSISNIKIESDTNNKQESLYKPPEKLHSSNASETEDQHLVVTDEQQKNCKELRNINCSDSVDGMFIPTSETPSITDEDDDQPCLDVALAFPEGKEVNLSEVETDSLVSACISDMSTDTLRKLKRCPKDFSLRMEIFHSKFVFQTGEGPTNNITMPSMADGTFHKKSDIIKIKSSAECCYVSQIIPIENSPTRPLKATDSEIFSVVNLMFPYCKSCNSLKSCQNLKCCKSKMNLWQCTRSMPLITNVRKLEENDDANDEFTKTDKKSWITKKRFKSSTFKLFGST